MKYYISFIFIMISILTSGQQIEIGKLWVGDTRNYLRFDSDAIRINFYWKYENNRYEIKRAYRYYFTKDTLRVIEDEGGKEKQHDFLVSKKDNEEMILRPITQYSKILTFDQVLQKEYFFKPQDKIVTDSIKFQKLLFSTTNCYGFCPAMSIQIDSNGAMQFQGGKYAVKQGFYQAKVTSEIFQQLLLIISTSDLDKVENYSQFNVDASTHTLEVYYNGRSMFIKSAFFPYVLNNLLEYLLALPSKVELKNSKEFIVKFSQ